MRRRRPLRVAFLTHEFYLGGAERWIASLCRWFNRDFVVPTVVAVNRIRGHNTIARAALPSDVAFLETAAVRDQWPAFADVVIGWGRCELERNVTRYGVPAVSCIHHAAVTKDGQWAKDAVGDAVESGALLVGVNEVCRSVLPPEHRDRMTVIANGGDVDRVVPQLGRDAFRKLHGIQEGQRLVGHIGRVMSDKDVGALARAMPYLPDNWRMMAMGPTLGHARPQVERLCDLADGRMFYLPARDHVGDALAGLDVFCLLSPSEAHPLSVSEAWLAGVPVVATANPWLDSIEAEYGAMCHKVSGKHEPKRIAEKIRVAEVGQEWAQRVQRIAREHYTSAAMARRWEEFLLGKFGAA